MNRREPPVIMGLGNVLWGDDGLGIAAVQRLLARFDVPSGVRVVDGGTLGLALLPIMQDAERALLIDAIRDPAAAPGAIVRLEGADVAPAVRERLSPHQIGVADLLEAARLTDCYPEQLVLLGIVPQRLELGFGLSPAVERQLDNLLKRVVEQALEWGCGFRLRSGGAEIDQGGAADGAAAKPAE